MAMTNIMGSSMTQATQESRAHSGIPVLGSEGQRRILVRCEQNRIATVEFSGLKSGSQDLIQGLTSLRQHWLRTGESKDSTVCSTSEYRQIRASGPAIARIQLTLICLT